MSFVFLLCFWLSSFCFVFGLLFENILKSNLLIKMSFLNLGNYWDRIRRCCPEGSELKIEFEQPHTFRDQIEEEHSEARTLRIKTEAGEKTGGWFTVSERNAIVAAAAKSLQSCPTLCDPIDGSPPGSPVPGILQARTLEWAAISFSNVWRWKEKVKSLSHVWLLATPWTAAYQAPPSMGFSR